MDEVGIDVGGTFTDFIFESNSRYTVAKVPTTQFNPSDAIIQGLGSLNTTVNKIVHSSTIATNTLLERNGAKTGLITSAGFRDILQIGRQVRSDIYELEPTPAPSLIHHEAIFEFPIKLDQNGKVLTNDNKTPEVLYQECLDFAAANQLESLAICLLYSYINDDLERGFESYYNDKRNNNSEYVPSFISISSVVSPEYREVERASTTVLNAYVGPAMNAYLKDFGERVRLMNDQHTADVKIVRSDGGSTSLQNASNLPVSTLLSGPSAGVLGAFSIAKQAGYRRIITFDMGGTSTDISLCDGHISFKNQLEVGGIHARTPIIDIHTIGAGGGSIARIDQGGALRVGPESAKSVPGPACYGNQKDSAVPAFTVTDANVILGRLPAESLLGNTLQLEVSESLRAATPFLEHFSTIEDFAQAVIDVTNSNMERAVRVVSVQQGYDPRDFTLVAFGGAGPLHACEVAESLDIDNVLIPRTPGVLAALGALLADETFTVSISVLSSCTKSNIEQIRRSIDEAKRRVVAKFGSTPELFEAVAQLRFSGQSHELNIRIPDVNNIDASAIALIRQSFIERHQSLYGHAGYEIELVNIQVTGSKPNNKPLPLYDSPKPVSPNPNNTLR
ncbi:MAG: hydantoinase/oxoprolinase family protein, partial [Dehalococcoidia bacterium]|nr:hydantoinase/oxoprolinase family protein [Dehalococcoidia bacterium]